MHTLYREPKKLPRGRVVSETKPAPRIKSMSGFAKFGRVGGKVTPGKDRM